MLPVLFLCLLQVLLILSVIVYYPAVTLELFVAHPSLINGTLSQHMEHVSIFRAAMPFPFMALSCLAALFSSTTASLAQKGVLTQDNQYHFDLMLELTPWDILFWLFCVSLHAIAISILMSPADLYAVLLSILVCTYFLGRLCAPCSQVNMTQGNVNLLGFCSGLLIAAYNIPDDHAGRPATLVLILFLDYMLGVGHAWDMPPTMDTVANCRLFYVCSSCLCLCALYGAWHDHLLLEVD
jgi:hypothetical protein